MFKLIKVLKETKPFSLKTDELNEAIVSKGGSQFHFKFIVIEGFFKTLIILKEFISVPFYTKSSFN